MFEQLYVEDEYNDYNYTVKQAGRLSECFYRTLEANPDRMEIALDVDGMHRSATVLRQGVRPVVYCGRESCSDG